MKNVLFLFSLAASVLLLTPPAVASVLADDFNDNSTNAVLWTTGVSGSGPSISEINQRVEISIPFSSTGAGFSAAYNSNCTIRGDYDAQVDYTLLTWPFANGVRISLATIPGGLVERASFGTADHIGSPREVYVRDFGGGGEAGITPTGDTSGKLRLVRTGGTLTPYYFSGGNWIPLPAGPTSTAPASITLNAFSDDAYFADQSVLVAFDNFVVNQGIVSCVPICIAAPKVESSVLGINGTATAGGSGIATVALVGGATNVTLTVTSFSPGAGSVTFRAVQTNSGLDAQGTVIVTDQGGFTCTVPVTFRVRTAGIPTDETLCATDTGEGYTFKVTSPVSQPAGTSACSGHLPTAADLIPGAYSFTGASRILSIRSPISGLDTQMDLTEAGAFDPRLRMLFSRSADGGTSFSPFTDVTVFTIPGSTRIRGTAQWSDVRVVAAGSDLWFATVAVPTMGEWAFAIMTLLLLTSASALLVRRARRAGLS